MIAPYPFSRAVFLYGDPIVIPRDGDVAEWRAKVEIALNELAGRAEDERWHARKGGERFWALGIVTPTQDASGAHTGYSKILRDMTDRKRAEEAGSKYLERPMHIGKLSAYITPGRIA